MKMFDCDWSPILELMPAWDEMTLASRRLFLDPNKAHTGGFPRDQYGKDAAIMLESGLVVSSPRECLVPEQDRGKAFRRIMMQLSKHLLFEPNVGSEAFDAYCSKHFTQEELYSLYNRDHDTEKPIQFLSEKWTRAFLEAADPSTWEKPFKIYEPSASRSGWIQITTSPPKESEKITYFTSPDVGQAALKLVRLARESSEPVPFVRLCDKEFQQFSTQVIADAIKACIRYTLVYPSLKSESYQACFWIWPPAGHRLHRPAARKVKSVPRGTHLLIPSFRLEDLSLIAARIAVEPLPVKQHSYPPDPYAKVQQEIIATMSPLPDLLAKRFRPENRLSEALKMLLDLDFVSVIKGKPMTLKLRKAGNEWVARTATERLSILLKSISARREKARTTYSESQRSQLLAFNPKQLYTRSGYHFSTVQLSSMLETVWSAAVEGEFYPLDEWITYHSQTSSPAGVHAHQGITDAPYSTIRSLEEDGEALLRKVHEHFFFERLIPFGGVELGQNSKGHLHFSLNKTGRYFLTGVGSVESAGESSGAIVVQPNFEIVFTEPNPMAEAELAGLAERIGSRIGTLFRLSKDSILKAALTGNNAQRTLASLDRIVAKPVPSNVRRQIEDWFRACRQVSMRRTLLLTFPDEVTAHTVSKELQGQCDPITPTLWEVRTKSIDKKILRNLEKKGIFLRTDE